MQELKLIKASEKDIPTIAALAELIWNQHYPSIITKQQINYMLNLMYNKESLERQMNVQGHDFYLIMKEQKEIGFISVKNEGPGDWFLNKFYINQELATQGLGTQSFEYLKQEIKPVKMTLTVNRKNYKSINFYFKLGFKIDRIEDFDIGNGYEMNDFVMVWPA
jgi:diamine N-acetyltransferase